MTSSVTALFTWLITYLPDFLMSHPVIDFLALAVVFIIVAFISRLLRNRV